MSPARTFRCWVPHCLNSRKRTRLPNSHYHAFPVRNAERCRRWLQAAGYEDLVYLPMHSLKLRYVCSEHFTESDYGRAASNSSLLLTAVPSIFPVGTIPLSDDIMEEWPPKMASEKSGRLRTECTPSLRPSISSRPLNSTDKLLASAISAGILQPSSPKEAVFSQPAECQSRKTTTFEPKRNFERYSLPKIVNKKTVTSSLPKVNVESVATSSFVELQPAIESGKKGPVLLQPTSSVEIKIETEAPSEVVTDISDSREDSGLSPLPMGLLLDHLKKNSGDGLLDGDMLLGFLVQRGSSVVLVPVGPDYSMMVESCPEELPSPAATVSSTELELTSTSSSLHGLSNTT